MYNPTMSGFKERSKNFFGYLDKVGTNATEFGNKTTENLRERTSKILVPQTSGYFSKKASEHDSKDNSEGDSKIDSMEDVEGFKINKKYQTIARRIAGLFPGSETQIKNNRPELTKTGMEIDNFKNAQQFLEKKEADWFQFLIENESRLEGVWNVYEKGRFERLVGSLVETLADAKNNKIFKEILASPWPEFDEKNYYDHLQHFMHESSCFKEENCKHETLTISYRYWRRMYSDLIRLEVEIEKNRLCNDDSCKDVIDHLKAEKGRVRKNYRASYDLLNKEIVKTGRGFNLAHGFACDMNCFMFFIALIIVMIVIIVFVVLTKDKHYPCQPPNLG